MSFLLSDPLCVFCQYEEELYDHLFFACEWTSCLWGKIKSWLRIGRNMTTLYSALRGLRFRKSNLEARMRSVSLGIVSTLYGKKGTSGYLKESAYELIESSGDFKSYSTQYSTSMSLTTPDWMLVEFILLLLLGLQASY